MAFQISGVEILSLHVQEFIFEPSNTANILQLHASFHSRDATSAGRSDDYFRLFPLCPCFFLQFQLLSF